MEIAGLGKTNGIRRQCIDDDIIMRRCAEIADSAIFRLVSLKLMGIRRQQGEIG